MMPPSINEDMVMSKKKRSKKKKLKVAKPRNVHALNPLMKKGGSHGKTEKAKRKQEKMSMKRELKQLPFPLYGGYFLRTLLTTIWYMSILTIKSPLKR